MPKVINIIDAPQRMRDLWKWVAAVDAWDWKDPKPLADLVTSEDIPEEFKKAVSDILSGERKRRRTQGAIEPKERMEIAKHISGVLSILDSFTYGKVAEQGYEGMSVPNYIVETKSNFPDVIDAYNYLINERRDLIQSSANDLEVSVETIENLLREMRKKIEKWPQI